VIALTCNSTSSWDWFTGTGRIDPLFEAPELRITEDVRRYGQEKV
jgi:hypothetical protein